MVLVVFQVVAGVLWRAPQAHTETLTEKAEKQAAQALLHEQLQAIEQEIAGLNAELSTVKGQKSTLQNKIAQLKSRESVLRLQTQAIDIQLVSLDDEYTQTLHEMADNEVQVRQYRTQIAEHIRTLHNAEHESLLVSILVEGKLSAAVDQVQHYKEVAASLQEVVHLTKEANARLEEQRLALRNQQEDIEHLQSMNVLAQQQLQGSLSEQGQLLQQTRGKESAYQAALSNTRKRAAEIRSRIYELQGISKQPTFGQAVELATEAGGLSGVRPAFLLAILTQESNLGKNVGTCNRLGDGPEKSWKVIMKPDRDQQPFVRITEELALDPDTTPVSCPMRGKDGKQVGWGGAMGPAQFIPSTWVGYKDKVAAITGKFANPWDIRDAFIASGLKLAAGGATQQAGEWAAAMRYFSGSTNPQFRFYGDNVIALADKYQGDIDALR